MSLPRSVRIGSAKYTVRIVDRLVDNGDHVDGHIDRARHLIRIDRDQTPASKFQTLWHEAVHGVLWNAGRDDEAEDEPLVEALAQGIAQLLADNPGMRGG